MAGRRDGRTNGQTDGKSPHSTGLYPLSGPLPCYSPTSTQKLYKAGQGYRWPYDASGQLVFFLSFLFSFFFPSRALFFSSFPSFLSPPRFFPFLACLPATFSCFLRAPFACSRTLLDPAYAPQPHPCTAPAHAPATCPCTALVHAPAYGNGSSFYDFLSPTDFQSVDYNITLIVSECVSVCDNP